MSEAPGHYRIFAEATTTEPAGFESASALTARAEKAEARVKELLAELAEQELEKLTLIRELKQTCQALHNATQGTAARLPRQ